MADVAEMVLTDTMARIAELCGLREATKEFGKFQAYYLGQSLNDPTGAWRSWCYKAVERQGAEGQTSDGEARHRAYVKEQCRKATVRMCGAYDKWTHDMTSPYNQTWASHVSVHDCGHAVCTYPHSISVPWVDEMPGEPGGAHVPGEYCRLEICGHSKPENDMEQEER